VIGGGCFRVNSFCEKTTPSYAGERKRNDIMKKTPDIIRVAVGQLQQKGSGGFFDERKRNRKFAAYKMEMSVSYSVVTMFYINRLSGI